jgi:hypothetical protein
MTVEPRAIGDDDCARIYASARSRRFGRLVRHTLAELWMRDRRRPYREVQSGEWSRQSLFNRRNEQQDNGARRAIDLASSDVQPASEKHEAILYRPEHAQYLNDKPEIQAEQEQRA